MSFWRLYYHLVWATKNREPLIQAEAEGRLYSYLVRKAVELEVHVYAVNGCSDHIHLIVAIPPKHAVADVVKGLKGASSHYLNQGTGPAYEFAWQRGYGALSLGEGQRPSAVAYVQKQKAHHEQQTTNSWLERDADLDEGPPDTGLEPPVLPLSLHEAPVSYSPWAEESFEQSTIIEEEDIP